MSNRSIHIVILCIAIFLWFSESTLAQTSTWTGAGADDTWLNADNWDTSTPNSASFDVNIGAPAPTDLNFSVNVNSVSIVPNGHLNIMTGQWLGFFGSTATNTLTNAGQINVLTGGGIRMRQTISNSATIVSSGTFEVQSDGATLSGGGNIIMDSGSSSIFGASNPVLTIVDQTIHGRGSIGANGMGFDIQDNGMIDADSDGNILLMDPNLSFGLINAGTIRASQGGILRLSGGSGGTFDNTDGIIQALDGSEVQLFVGATITGGTLSTEGSGAFRTNVSGYLYDLTSTGTVINTNGTILGIGGAIINSGAIEVDSTGSGTLLEVQAPGATLTGGGVVNLNNSNALISGLSNAELTIEDQTIAGLGIVGSNAIGIHILSDGLINANSSGELLDIDPDATTGLTNVGIMQASDGGILRLTGRFGGDFENSNGTIQALDGSEVQFLGSARINGGTLTSTGSGQLRNVEFAYFSDLDLTTSLYAGNGTFTGLGGVINNSGSIQIDSTGGVTILRIEPGVTELIGGGVVKLSGNNVFVDGGTSSPLLRIVDQTIEGFGNLGSGSTSISNEVDGVIDANVEYGGLSNGITIDTDLPFFANQGSLLVRNGSRMIIAEPLLNQATGRVAISPNALGDALQIQTNFLNRGRFEGEGNVRVYGNSPDANFYDELGVVAPGGTDGTGKIFIFPDATSVSHDAALTNGHVLEIEIASASDYDQLRIGGAGELTIWEKGIDQPLLDVRLIGGFVPSTSDTFTLLEHPNNLISGEYDNAANGDRLLLSDSAGSFEVVYSFGCIQLRDFVPTLFGDVNRDNEVNLLDVAPFIELLATGDFQAEADVNQDGEVNLLDVDPFIETLASN